MDIRPKQLGTRMQLILTGDADLYGFFKVFITQSFTENTQRFTEKKYFNPLVTIVPERFLCKIDEGSFRLAGIM